MKFTYHKMLGAAKNLNEDFDCAVKAVAIAGQLPYDKVHAAFKKHGREDGKRTPTAVTWLAMNELGLKATLKTSFTPAKGKPFVIKDGERPICAIGWVENMLPEGRHMVFVKGHVAAVVDGKLEDWTAGRRFAITHVFEVEAVTTKPAAKKATRKPAVKKAPAKRKAPAKKPVTKLNPALNLIDAEIEAAKKGE
jgi:hypothetical protein